MGSLAKCPHCGKPIIIEPTIKVDVQIAKFNLEELLDGNGNEPAGKKGSGD